MPSYVFICDAGLAEPEGPGAPLGCSDSLVPYEYTSTATFNPATDLDPVLIVGAVGVGFFVLLPIWAAALGVRALIKAIR